MSAATSTVAALSFINGKHCRCVWYISGSSTPLFPIPRCRASLPSRQNLRRMANWNARGPPDPKTPPAVLTGLPKLDDRLGLLLSGERVFANPE